MRRTLKWTLRAMGAVAGAYTAYATVTWIRYGHAAPPSHWPADPLLDRFMPEYETAERHITYVAAPAAVTLETACGQDLASSRIVRAIFRLRELVLGTSRDSAERPRALLPLTQSLGWGLLAEVPDREIVMGAVTRPWEPNVVFRAIAPEAFASFADPGYVKIVWNLRARPIGPGHSLFTTETRAATTDGAARRKFRRYWAAFSAGIWTIRRLSLGPLRRQAERRARALQ